MISVVRSFLGAALLLTGVSAAMAASGTPVAGQVRQTGTSTGTVASNNAPAVNQPVQPGAPAALAAPKSAAVAAPVVEQPKKPLNQTFSDNNDPNAGFAPNSTAAARAFFVPQY